MLSTRNLAGACARHPWRTLAAWAAAIAVSAVLVGAFLGDGLTSEGAVTNDAESLRANDLVREHMPPREFVTDELVVVRSEELTVDDPAFRAKLEELAAAGAATGAIAAARTPLDDPSLVSRDRHAALLLLDLAPGGEDGITEVIDVVEAADGEDGFEVSVTGAFTVDHTFGELSERDLRDGELRFGLPAALVVLVLVFGALVASALPLLLALVSIAVGLGLTALVAAQWELSLFVVNMLTGMGLALGIDYALFVVSRFREERAGGRTKHAAIEAAGATASRAVLFSGSAFVLAMLGLLLVQSTIMRSLATGAILVGVVSVAAALTLLPALLSLLGDGVNRLRVPVIGRHVADGQGVESRLWGGVVRRVLRRPALSFALAAGLLAAAALPLATMDIGAAGIGTLPDETVAKRGFVALQRSFPAAGADPVYVVVDADFRSADVGDAVALLEERLAADPGFGAAELRIGPRRNLAVLTVDLAGDPLGDEAVAAVRELRAETIPAAFRGVDADVLVTGATAENVDYFDVMTRWLPIVIAFVLGLSFLLLAVAFRSLAVPATAIVLNLLSVGATYGLLVAVFQHGVLEELFGFQQVAIVEAWVPLFLFAVLFGLSMDYQVFLLSRIRERYSHTRDTLDAVRFGVGSTGRIITGAALIIVAVFAGFASGDLVMFQQMGFGIAVALLIDATIVRSVLVPAAMALLGERNWWLPRRLEWLPHVEVEGHADGAAAAPRSQPARSGHTSAPANKGAAMDDRDTLRDDEMETTGHSMPEPAGDDSDSTDADDADQSDADDADDADQDDAG